MWKNNFASTILIIMKALKNNSRPWSTSPLSLCSAILSLTIIHWYFLHLLLVIPLKNMFWSPKLGHASLYKLIVKLYKEIALLSATLPTNWVGAPQTKRSGKGCLVGKWGCLKHGCLVDCEFKEPRVKEPIQMLSSNESISSSNNDLYVIK